MLARDKVDDQRVDLCLSVRRTGEGRVAAEVLVVHGFERYHVEILAHAVAGQHGAGKLRGLLDIVRGAGGDGAEHDLLRGAAAGESGNLVLQLLFVHQVVVALLDLHRVAQRTGGAGDDGDLLHGGGVGLLRGDERVADLVVGDDALLGVGEDGVLLLVARDDDLEESIEVVIAGYQKKNAILTDAEKRIVAYHEIGHALVAAKQTNSAPVQKITIIPRTSGALGYTMQVEEGNHYLMNKEELENKIATLTGGRAAEEVVFGSITTGASNDIEQATKLARAMLTRYGMSKDFDMVALETVNNQYLGGDTSLACSPDTQAKIDALVIDLVTRQHEKAIGILKENRAKLDELADFLYSRETITGEEFMKILNK